MSTRLSTLLLSCLSFGLAAQSEPVPGKSDQQVSILKVGKLLPRLEPSIDDTRDQASRNAARKAALKDLASLLSKFIQPPLDDDEEITPLGLERLVVSASPQKVAWLHRTLKRQQDDLDRVIVRKVQIWTLSRKDFAAQIAPVMDQGRKIDLPQPTRARLREKDGKAKAELIMAQAEAAAKNGPRLQRIVALPAGKLPRAPEKDKLAVPLPKGAFPHISQTLRSRWTLAAELQRCNQTSYIKDFEIERHKDKVIANPIIDIIKDGVILRLSQIHLDEGRIGIDLRLNIAKLHRPIPTFDTRIGQSKVTIQLPELSSTRLAGHFEQRPGEGLLISLPLDKQRVLLASID